MMDIDRLLENDYLIFSFVVFAFFFVPKSWETTNSITDPSLDALGFSLGKNRDPTDPTEASVNLGVLVCIDCSGTHRSLGVHVSVRERGKSEGKWEKEIGDGVLEAFLFLFPFLESKEWVVFWKA